MAWFVLTLPSQVSPTWARRVTPEVPPVDLTLCLERLFLLPRKISLSSSSIQEIEGRFNADQEAFSAGAGRSMQRVRGISGTRKDDGQERPWFAERDLAVLSGVSS
jgi:hypothetical protein